jgi:hypothetical protein
VVPAPLRELAGAAGADPAAGEDAAGCAVGSRDPDGGWVDPPLVGKFKTGPTGGVFTGGVWTGRGGVLTGGVLTLGVLTCGVVTCGVVTCGVVIGPAVTAGDVTEGTVTDGTVTDGSDTVVSGEDAVAGPARRTSAPTIAKTETATHTVATNHDHLPHGLSTVDGVDIAHRPKVPPAFT